MTGDRTTWSTLLPIVQAFVEGKPVERLGYDGRYTRITVLYDLLSATHRLATGDSKPGIWSVHYEDRGQDALGAPVKNGIASWVGSSNDSPPWRRHRQGVNGNETYDMTTEVFSEVSAIEGESDDTTV